MQAGKSENGTAHTGKKTITETIRKGEKEHGIYIADTGKFTEGAHLLQYDREKRGSQRHG